MSDVRTQDQRIDAYISKCGDFAKPILNHLRKLIHEGCPDVQETIKWGMPFFEYKGPVCNMASFKEHAVLGFWKAELMMDSEKQLKKRANQGGEAMGHLGRITKLEDLPPDEVILGFIKQAVLLNIEGKKLPKKEAKSKTELEVPKELTDLLNKNEDARITFEAFSPSHRKEYITWIAEAKAEETRNRRLESTIEMLKEGKTRHWKHQKK